MIIFRGFQGGFQLRKLKLWLLSLNRFRPQILLLVIVTGYPLKLLSEDTIQVWLHDAYNWFESLLRPDVHSTWNIPVRVIFM